MYWWKGACRDGPVHRDGKDPISVVKGAAGDSDDGEYLWNQTIVCQLNPLELEFCNQYR